MPEKRYLPQEFGARLRTEMDRCGMGYVDFHEKVRVSLKNVSLHDIINFQNVNALISRRLL